MSILWRIKKAFKSIFVFRHDKWVKPDPVNPSRVDLSYMIKPRKFNKKVRQYR